MVRNKYLILPFLLFAWTIIFVHSIVPHNHHSEKLFTKCNTEHIFEGNSFEFTEIHDCEQDCNDHACHFHVEILTRISLDNIFIINTEDEFLNHISFLETKNSSFYIEFISDQIPQSNYLRGPPQIS
ncbi:MAG: hypothetical protein GQ564_15775 [Bacteroidales bacterium]|nr:hypothetical protein [Bacteroidales bacterium]